MNNTEERTMTYLVTIDSILKAAQAEGTLDPLYTWTPVALANILLDLEEPVYIHNGVPLVDEVIGEKLAAYIRDFMIPAGETGAGTAPKFPDVTVQLSGEDGNAFAVLANVKKALDRAGHREAGAEFLTEATSGDYDHLLQTAMRWVNVE